jgi:hypothetical protein
MQFDFQGVRYRIGFQHSKPSDSTEIAAHIGHALTADQIPHSPAFVCCVECNLVLDGKKGRTTRCAIWVNVDGVWSENAVGVAKVNIEAGDHFERETGRKQSLAHALNGHGFTKDFRNAAWGAYLNRKTIQTEITQIQAALTKSQSDVAAMAAWIETGSPSAKMRSASSRPSASSGS